MVSMAWDDEINITLTKFDVEELMRMVRKHIRDGSDYVEEMRGWIVIHDKLEKTLKENSVNE